MFKREMKINLKNFLIWSGILIGIFLVVYLIYPSIASSDNVKAIDEMMKLFPPEILKAFNMDISSINSVFGWLKSEGFVFVLLVIGSYAGILGSNIVLKEESDKTIEYLNSLPVTRSQILWSKISCGLIYIISMVVLLGIFNFIGLTISGDFELKLFILLSISPIFSSITIFSLCLLISTFMHKQKKMLGISLGIVFISYILHLLSTLGETTEFLKYASLFTLADIRNIIVKIEINPMLVLLSVGIALILLVGAAINYNKKELL